MDRPNEINDKRLRFDSFSDPAPMYGKRKLLPAMGHEATFVELPWEVD